MTILLYCLCAVLLVVTGAVVSGGFALPNHTHSASDGVQAEDTLTQDIAALLDYTGADHEEANE